MLSSRLEECLSEFQGVCYYEADACMVVDRSGHVQPMETSHFSDSDVCVILDETHCRCVPICSIWRGRR